MKNPARCCMALALALLAACASQQQHQQLTYLSRGLTTAELAILTELAPKVRIVPDLTRETALQHAAKAHGVDAHLITPAFLRAAAKLRWVQAWSAGVDRYIGIKELVENDAIVFTNMKGVHGPVIAEHVFAMLLSLTRGLPEYRQAQVEGRWARGAAKTSALQGRSMLVVGLGGIGSEVARRAKAFGMQVLATVRTARPAPAYVDRLGVGDDLDALIAEADVVVLCVPLTAETKGLFDAARINRMRDGAYLVNIARGAVCDTDALLRAIDSGKLAGLCLDVTDPEPLPAEHPLWQRANVIITPHVAARAELTLERRQAMFRENLRRFGAGKPLLNVVDKAAGY